MTVLIKPVHRWYCPNCTVESVTHEAQPHTRFHPCKGLKGLIGPMIEVGTKAKVEVKEREDYIGDETVTLHEGRPVMSVVTTRETGQDVAVFAPAATGSHKEF